MRNALVLILIAVLVGASTVHAQARTAVGFVIGGNYNIHSGAALQKTGIGVGLVAGGQLDISFTKSLALLTTIYGYDNRIGNYTQTLTQGGVDYSLDVSVTVAYAGVEPLLKITMPDIRFYIVAGPSIAFKVEGQSEVNTTITTPGYAFPSGYTSQTSSGDIADAKTRFELNFGGGYIFRIDQQSRLTTQLSFTYGLNTVQKNVDWRVNSIRLIAGLEFDVFQ
jgi:hypothetical protein